VPPAVDTALVRDGIADDPRQRELEAEFLARHGVPVERVVWRVLDRLPRRPYRIRVGAMLHGLDIASRWCPATVHRVVAANRSRMPFA